MGELSRATRNQIKFAKLFVIRERERVHSRVLFIFIEIQFSQIIWLVSFVASTKLFGLEDCSSACARACACPALQRGFLFIISEALGNHKWFFSMTSNTIERGKPVLQQCHPPGLATMPAWLPALPVSLLLGFAYDKASKL